MTGPLTGDRGPGALLTAASWPGACRSALVNPAAGPTVARADAGGYRHFQKLADALAGQPPAGFFRGGNAAPAPPGPPSRPDPSCCSPADGIGRGRVPLHLDRYRGATGGQHQGRARTRLGEDHAPAPIHHAIHRPRAPGRAAQRSEAIPVTATPPPGPTLRQAPRRMGARRNRSRAGQQISPYLKRSSPAMTPSGTCPKSVNTRISRSSGLRERPARATAHDFCFQVDVSPVLQVPG